MDKGKVSVLLLATFFSFLSSTTSAEASGGAGIEVTCVENSHALVSPFEPDFKYLIAITNTGDREDIIHVTPQIEAPPEGWFSLGPGGPMRLEPGEEGYHAVFIESTGAPDGSVFTLPITISSQNDPSLRKTVTLTTTIKDLGPFHSLPRDSAVQGKVYDIENGEPIANAEVRLHLWNGHLGDYGTTDASGNYQIFCLSHEYMKQIQETYNTRSPPSYYLEVHATGYRSYHENEIMPPEGGTLTKDIYLDRQLENAGYQLSWEHPLTFGAWKCPTSENWDYIAVGSGEHDHPEETTVFKFSLFSSAGELLYSHQTETQLWGIDISRDGRYLAAGSQDPEERVYLYDRIEDSLWTHYAGGSCREVRFSHGGHYLAVGPTQSGAGYLGIFDVATYQLIWENDTGDWVRAIAFAPDDSYVAITNSGDYMYTFNTTDGSLRWKRFHGGYCAFFLDISQDGSRIATGGKSHEVRMFDNQGNLLWTHPVEQAFCGSMSSDGSRIIVGTVWGSVYFIDGQGNLLWRRSEMWGCTESTSQRTENTSR